MSGEKFGLNIKKPQRLVCGSLSQVERQPSRLVNRLVPKKVEVKVGEEHEIFRERITRAVCVTSDVNKARRERQGLGAVVHRRLLFANR
jgi:hypothetical protein